MSCDKNLRIGDRVFNEVRMKKPCGGSSEAEELARKEMEYSLEDERTDVLS